MSVNNRIVAGILACLILMIQAPFSMATEIHKWIDSNGVTHYSEEAPENEQFSSHRVELPEQNVSAGPGKTDDDYYSVINQASRLEASRLAREEGRRKDRELNLRAEALAAQRVPVVIDTLQDDRYYPAFFHGRGFHDNRFQGRHGFYGKQGYFDDKRRYDRYRRGGGRDGGYKNRLNRRGGSAFKPSAYQGR